MAVVLNAKGTSISSFQIGKQGPIIKNNSGTIEFRNSADTDFVSINANNLDLINDTTPQLGGQLDINGFAIGNGTEELVKFIEIASAVNEITITNSATGNNPRITASGNDAAIGLDIRSKGASVINFDTASGSNRQVQITNTASAINYITLTGSATGNATNISVAGSDTNIDLQLSAKGTGQILLGGNIGDTNSFQAENDQILIVKGGNSVAVDAGNLVLEGGNGTGSFASGDVVIRGGIGGTASGTITLDSGVEVGAPAGGNKGDGSINAGSFYIDGNILPTVLSGTAVLDFGSIASFDQTDLTITVTGAVVGDEILLGLPAAPTAGIIFNAFVSAVDTITVRAHNYTAGAIDPASATYNAKVFQ